jgi:hypothetical protein
MRAAISHDLQAVLFPSGDADQESSEACFTFVKAAGCRIENDLWNEEIWFIKDAIVEQRPPVRDVSRYSRPASGPQPRIVGYEW